VLRFLVYLGDGLDNEKKNKFKVIFDTISDRS